MSRIFYPKTENLKLTIVEELKQVNGNIEQSLLSLQEHYKDFFNANSTVSIDEYVEKFNQLNKTIQKELFLEDGSVKHGLFKADGQTLKTAIYLKLKPLEEAIFEMENECVPVVKQLWKEQLTPLSSYNPNKEFHLLVKVISNWRDHINTPEKIAYMESRVGNSCSYVTKEHVNLFQIGNSQFGYVYELNDGFLGACECDADLEEFVKGENLIKPDRYYSDLACLLRETNHHITNGGFASKIATPKQILNTKEYNEVITDSRFCKPVAICYFSFGQKFLSKDYETAKQLATESGLPLLEIPQLNLPENMFNNFSIQAMIEKPVRKNAVLYNEIAKKGVSVAKNFMDALASSYIKPEKVEDYELIAMKECCSLARRIMLDNPNTKEEFNQSIGNYFAEVGIPVAPITYYTEEIQQKFYANNHKETDEEKSLSQEK